MWVATENGGLDILVMDLDTGEFERDMSYLTKSDKQFNPFGDIDEITEEEFKAIVSRIRQQLPQYRNLIM